MNKAQDIDIIARDLAWNLSLDQLRERWEARQNLYASHTADSPEVIAYREKYWQRCQTADNSPLFVTRQTRQEMDYETARRKVVELLNERGDQIARIENNPDFRWVFNDDEKTIIKNLVKYFINDPSGDYPLAKGLFVYGPPGTGKTELMRIMSLFTTGASLTKAFVFTSLSEVHLKTKTDKSYDPIELNVQHDRCFDEFCRFVGPVNRFGEPIDINEALIELRYERNKRYGQLTHFIANTTPDESESAFTAMIFDRLKSMCTSVVFRGASKRK